MKILQQLRHRMSSIRRKTSLRQEIQVERFSYGQNNFKVLFSICASEQCNI